MINFIWSWVIVLKVYFQDKSRLKLLMCFSPFPFVFFGSGIEFDNDKALPGSSVFVIRRPVSDLGLAGLRLESLWRNSYRCDHEFKFPRNISDDNWRVMDGTGGRNWLESKASGGRALAIAVLIVLILSQIYSAEISHKIHVLPTKT
jgi:hypothetical protein